MKRKILLWLIVLVVMFNAASAFDFEVNYSTLNKNDYVTQRPFDNIAIQQLRYEPYPANPGEYITLWIKAQNTGNRDTENAIFELLPKYPFSLDTNEDPIREFGQLNSEPVVLEYKIRVDKDAVEGTNEIDMKYSYNENEDEWVTKTFEIEIEDVQTDFDLVVQEISNGDVSLAIANTGKNVAYSVIVRIPKQEGYQTTGVSGQMVGNLEDGDYTLVGFGIANTARTSSPLKVQIDYTDTIGERRSVVKEVDYNLDTEGGNGFGSLPEGMTREEFTAQRKGMIQAPAIYQQWWFWAIMIVVLYAGWKGYKSFRKYRQEKEENKTKK
ncbi:hypothetical protein ACFL6I_09590 [candidate division KSB1 bacterium]